MAKVFLIFADSSALEYFSLFDEETVVRSAKRFAEETVGRFVEETAVRSEWRSAERR